MQIAIVVFLSWAAIAVGEASALYLVTDLGTLGGASSSAYALNQSGVVVGAADLPSQSGNAFLYSGNTITALNSPGALVSQANGINSTQQVAGTTYTSTGARATLWINGTAGDLGTLGGTDSFAMALNDAGVVVGASSLPNGDVLAFTYASGLMTSLGALGAGTWSAAYGINANNQVAGSSDNGSGSTHAVRWNSVGGISDLGTLGGMNSYGMAINNSGNVTGFSASVSGYLRAFLYAAGSMTALGTLGGTSSYAFGINSSSTVVGYGDVMGLDQSHAFIWSNGTMTDLNTLVGGSGWELNQAYAINDNGQIVGSGTRDGLTHAFRLDPVVSTSFVASITAAVPEPGTANIGAGLVALAGLYRTLRYRR